MEKIVLKDNQPDEREGNQLNTDFDSGKFFDLNLAVIQGRKEILSHARAFAKKYPSILRGVWMQVPNDFGQLVGYPNAYCGIALPVCDEARRMLVGLKKNPDLIFKHVGPAEQSWWNRKKIIDIASAMLESMKEQK